MKKAALRGVQILRQATPATSFSKGGYILVQTLLFNLLASFSKGGKEVEGHAILLKQIIYEYYP
jgi:hypothetical protein